MEIWLSNLSYHSCQIIVYFFVCFMFFCCNPFDKGSGLVRITNKSAINKIREQIGNTHIVQADPTKKFATDIRKELSTLNKKGRFTKK